jgi:hypothetical protein
MIANWSLDSPEPAPPGHVTGVTQLERFFRVAAGLTVDKQELKHYGDFINQKIEDLLVCAIETARSNGRKVIQPSDLPITKGLRACIDAFARIDREVALQPILDRLVTRPTLELAYSDETEATFAAIAGGLSVALARSFEIIDPRQKHPHGEEWQRSMRVFDLLV